MEIMSDSVDTVPSTDISCVHRVKVRNRVNGAQTRQLGQLSHNLSHPVPLYLAMSTFRSFFFSFPPQ